MEQEREGGQWRTDVLGPDLTRAVTGVTAWMRSGASTVCAIGAASGTDNCEYSEP